jgi:hypothetical protein
MARAPIDFPLHLTTVPVNFLNNTTTSARAEGNNASWLCPCGDPLPLLGRCYYQFNDTCYTVCPNPSCGRRYRVMGARTSPTGGRQTTHVQEI